MDCDMYHTAAVSHAGIAFYLYFLATQREFAYREWKNQMMTRLQVSWRRPLSSGLAFFLSGTAASNLSVF